MPVAIIIFEVGLLTATLMAIVLAQVVWTNHALKGTRALAGLMISAGVWALFYALELMSARMEIKLLWAKLQYIGITAVPFFWLVSTLQYTQAPGMTTIPKWVTLVLSLEPFLTLMLIFTNERHGLVWREVIWSIVGNQQIAIFQKGIWYWVNIGYSYILLMSGVICIGMYMFRKMQKHKKQVVSLLVVIIAPWLGNVIYITGLSPLPYLDFTPFGFIIAGIAFILGVYKFGLFSVVPFARDILVEYISDAVIVMDCQGRVVDMNSTAMQITHRSKEKVLGESGAELFPTIPGITTCNTSPVAMKFDQLLSTDDLLPEASDLENASTDSQQFYDVTINPVYTRRKRYIGHLIILRDVTTHIQMQNYLENQQHKLESMVVERTAELSQTNTQLTIEINERRQAEQALAENLGQLEEIISQRTANLKESNARLQQEIMNGEHLVTALARSEALYRRLVETAPDAIAYTDLEGRVLTANLQAAEMHGYSTVAEAIGMNAFNFLMLDEKSNLAETLQQFMDKGVAHGLEYELVRTDGTTYLIEVSVSVVTDVSGQPIGYIAVYRDITEQKHTQQLLEISNQNLELRVQQRTAELQTLNRALRDSEIKLLEANRLAHFGNWEWDFTSNKLVGSDEIYRILDISPDIFPHSPEELLNWVHPEDRDQVIVAVDNALNNNAIFNVEFRIIRQDGSIRFVHGQGTITTDTLGKLIWVGAVQDITTHSLVEQTLKQQNEKLVALNQVAATISQELDLPVALQATLTTILEVSNLHSAWILLMQEDGELSLAASQGLSDIDITTYTHNFDTEIKSVLQSKEPRSFKLDASRFTSIEPINDMSLILVPIQARDAVLGIFGALCIPMQFSESEYFSLLTAISNQIGLAVENTSLLNRTAQIEILQELERLRSELIANVSHELRTPLGLITLFTSNLLLEEIEFPKNKQREFLQGIKDEAEHLEHIVNDLLNIGRIDGGKLKLDQQPTDFEKIAKHTVSAMEAEFGQRRFAFDFPATPLVANLDQKRIEQVIRNLISNAIKYSPDGSVITISGYRDTEQCGLCIIDQGIGIPTQEQELIFQRFYRIDNDITRRTRGTGLGLAISKALVEAHNGRIWVESTPGEGSTFCISFSALIPHAAFTRHAQ